MLALYHKIKEEADNYDGVVITHGTDTLEETAYFLDTMKIPPIPIVLTGAMRSSNELGSDGVYNYLSALRVASDDKAADKGVLVVMNDEIHAAKYVTKTHTTNVSTFQTPTHGPLGLIMKQEILYFKTAEPRVRFNLEHIQGLVPIISAYAGMTDELIDMLDLEQAIFPKKQLKSWKISSKKESQSPWSHVVLMVLLNLSTPTKVEGCSCNELVFSLSKNSTLKKRASNY